MSDEDGFAGVRAARAEDEEAIYNLLLLLHAENGLFSVDENKSRQMIRYGTEAKGGFIGVIEGPNGIEGCVVLILTTFWYTTDFHLEELCLFVHPDKRRTTHAKRLVEFAKWTSRRLTELSGMPVPLLIGILTTHKLEPKMRLYQRQVRQIGATFQYGFDLPDSFNQRRIGPAPPIDELRARAKALAHAHAR